MEVLPVRTLEEMQALTPTSTVKIKHSTTTFQIKVQLSLEAYLPQFLLQYICLAFNNKKEMQKGRGRAKTKARTLSEETKQASKSDSNMTETSGIIK